MQQPVEKVLRLISNYTKLEKYNVINIGKTTLLPANKNLRSNNNEITLNLQPKASQETSPSIVTSDMTGFAC